MVALGVCMVAMGGMCGCSGGHAWLLLGVHAWLLWGACVVAPGGCMVAAGGHAWLLWGGMWDVMRYGDTINERAVRILLECILAYY